MPHLRVEDGMAAVLHCSRAMAPTLHLLRWPAVLYEKGGHLRPPLQSVVRLKPLRALEDGGDALAAADVGA